MSHWRPLSEPGGPDPRPLAESLQRYRTTLTAVAEKWTDVAGEAVAEHARPVAVRDGALVVEVDDPAWGSQLKWLGTNLLARLTEVLGEPVADRLEIRVSPKR